MSSHTAEVSGACRSSSHVSSSASLSSSPAPAKADDPASSAASCNSAKASLSSPSLSSSSEATASSALHDSLATFSTAASSRATCGALAARVAVLVHRWDVTRRTSAHGFAASLRGAALQQERKSLAHVTYTAAFLSRSAMHAIASGPRMLHERKPRLVSVLLRSRDVTYQRPLRFGGKQLAGLDHTSSHVPQLSSDGLIRGRHALAFYVAGTKRGLFWAPRGRARLAASPPPPAGSATTDMRMSTLTELFADLEPIPQDEGPEPIVRIAYPEGFQTVMDYFRRVLVNGAN
eukprot:scaffold29945_cov112-Isochrysis_galbana.AAC.6